MNNNLNKTEQEIRQEIISFSQEVENCAFLQKKESNIFNRVCQLLGLGDPVTNEDINAQVVKTTEYAKNILNSLSSEASTLDNSIIYDENSIFKIAITKLFYQIVPELEDTPFSVDKLPKEVENYLNPDLKILRDKKNNSIEDPPEDRLARRWERGSLAVRIKHGIIRNKGEGGSVLVRDINGKLVGVFKPELTNLSLIARIKNIFKSTFGQKSYLSSTVKEAEVEKAVFIISESLNFNLTPVSIEKELSDKKGFFQTYLSKEKNLKPNSQAQETDESIPTKENKSTTESEVQETDESIPRYEEAKKCSAVLNKDSYDEEEETTFQLFAIFDFLIGNLDRHEENWLLIMQNNKLISIKAIDNAHSLPIRQPDKDSLGARNQYKWKEYKIAKSKFTEKTIQFVNENLSEANIEKVISTVGEKVPKFLKDEMQELFLIRVACIRKLVNKDNSSETLANCNSMEEMTELID
jgi:hypothetical protein